MNKSTAKTRAKTKKSNKKASNNKFFLTLAGIGVIVVGVFMANSLFTKQVSQERASQLCSEFTEEVKANIMAVPGYTLDSIDSSCNTESDESGGIDYIPAVVAVLKADNLSTVEAMTSSMNTLAERLPARDYPVTINNIPAADGTQPAICLNASKYIDNDGKDLSLGTGGNRASYIEPGSVDGYAPCSEI